MKQFYSIAFYSLFLFLFCNLHAQTTTTIQPGPDEGKDALIHGLSSQINTNYGNNPQFSCNAWTFQGEPGVVRSAIEFDLSVIPANAEIISAYLSLYAWDSDDGFGKHSNQSGSNTSYLQRITSPWNEATVNWTSHPQATDINQVEINQSNSEDQNYENINVTLLIQDMMEDPANSFGFLIRLKEESFYRRLNFASSDHQDPNKRPKLVVTYFPSIESDTCVVIRPGSEAGKDAILHGLISEVNSNYGNNQQFSASTWTFQGTPGPVRSIIDFDLSELPENLIINNAYISLFAWDSEGGFGQHSTMSGSNAAWLKRVTSEWNEDLVTWTNKPSTSELNKTEIPATSSPNQNFIDINVSFLVQDMLDEPNSSFGFQLELKNEMAYRLMNFASSDHENSNLHPQLKVCYDIVSHNQDWNFDPTNISIYPNPANEWIKIDWAIESSAIDEMDVRIIDSSGKLMVRQNNLTKKSNIDISSLAEGLYFVEFVSQGKHVTKKLIVY